MNLTQRPLARLFFGLAMNGRLKFHQGMCRDSDSLTTRVQRVAPRMGALGLAFLSIVGISGCQVSRPPDVPASVLDNAQFMEAWKTYLHCRSSRELGEIRADLERLNRVTSSHALSLRNHPSVLLLPAAMRSLIATLPSRVAVDPQAMTAACARHGGHVAHTAGQPELSEELLAGVPEAQEESAYGDYIVRAGHRLKRMD
ncbi:MAG: exported protein of unknown function [Nitrospira sp.]|jgi:hypothetical protein|nr:exported protein of unknown function [Nitrospira sp.]